MNHNEYANEIKQEQQEAAHDALIESFEALGLDKQMQAIVDLGPEVLGWYANEAEFSTTREYLSWLREDEQAGERQEVLEQEMGRHEFYEFVLADEIKASREAELAEYRDMVAERWEGVADLPF